MAAAHAHTSTQAHKHTSTQAHKHTHTCTRAQHAQVGLLLPLSVTGFVWGVLYVGSGNLLVPILIHALWNTRVFLGSYLGL